MYLLIIQGGMLPTKLPMQVTLPFSCKSMSVADMCRCRCRCIDVSSWMSMLAIQVEESNIL